MTDLWGTLSLEEAIWLVTNIGGLILAVAAAFEAQLDLEATKILAGHGIGDPDTRARLLKAAGNRRDEGLKVLAHAVMLLTGIIVASSPTPRAPYEAFSAFWSSLAIITVALALGAGSVFSLRDRRILWAMFEVGDPSSAPDTDGQDADKEGV